MTRTDPKIAVIIAAAGRSERFASSTPKVWQPLAGKTLIEYAWRSFAPESLDRHAQQHRVSWIGIAVNAEYTDRAKSYVEDCPVPLHIVAGGETRAESVYRVLEQVPSDIDIIAVHDAARPFWPGERWDDLVRTASEYGAAILAVPVSDTIKRTDKEQLYTVDRSDLWAAQTPQVIRADLLRDAYARAAGTGMDATDDADLVQRIGGTVRVVESTSQNFKITTKSDWEVAEALMANSHTEVSMRCGHGYDAHRLGSDSPLMLGGVRLADTGGLIGHSDGDVLLHAVCDALLGAAALGDIGQHFPPTDPQYKGCDSRELLRTTANIILDHGFEAAQVDATVLAEAPRLSPHIAAMRECIADHLGLTVGAVSVKATTTEGMGFVGRGEGIAAHAVAMIRPARSGG
jgi:2-C-methyl-D-erythritol 4-phosphate cytidylyltransferase/2-C-methyl-D-erythritol 2,4-cyclodiphosphate synthase